MERKFATFTVGGSNERTIRPWGLPCVIALRFVCAMGHTYKAFAQKTLIKARSLYDISVRLTSSVGPRFSYHIIPNFS